MLNVEALLNVLAATYVLLVTGERKFSRKALAYMYHREVCEVMEKHHPGIAGEVGYRFALGVLANLPKDNQEKQTPA